MTDEIKQWLERDEIELLEKSKNDKAILIGTDIRIPLYRLAEEREKNAVIRGELQWHSNNAVSFKNELASANKKIEDCEKALRDLKAYATKDGANWNTVLTIVERALSQASEGEE